MMNPLWLFLIVPLSAGIGAVCMVLLIAASREDDEMNYEEWYK